MINNYWMDLFRVQHQGHHLPAILDLSTQLGNIFSSGMLHVHKLVANFT